MVAIADTRRLGVEVFDREVRALPAAARWAAANPEQVLATTARVDLADGSSWLRECWERAVSELGGQRVEIPCAARRCPATSSRPPMPFAPPRARRDRRGRAPLDRPSSGERARRPGATATLVRGRRGDDAVASWLDTVFSI